MNDLFAVLRRWLSALLGIVFPRCCTVCRCVLGGDNETYLCADCLRELPRTRFHRRRDNPMRKSVESGAPVVKAAAFYYYSAESPYAELVRQLKYQGEQWLGIALGKLIAAELSADSDFFMGIDLVVPVPLHPIRKRRRGYNQSECLAKGLSERLNVPMERDAVIRVRNTETQTSKTREQRFINMLDAFRVSQPARLAGKHILLVDDVWTTGSTVNACMRALRSVERISITVLTLACARRD
ncbi:MAG: ComF family protein [Prevotellaceae bacterium]|nr:ComF family protein [Prevotellaceae bacterium]